MSRLQRVKKLKPQKLNISKNNLERAVKSSLFFLSFDDLTLTVGDKALLEHETFSVAYNNIILIKGRVGTGKSSILKMLGGLIAPLSGSFSNADSEDLSLKPIFIHSQSEFNFVTGYIRDELTFAGVPDDDFKDILGRSVYDMSGGELKKLSILMALARSGSGVILLDEPLDMLDDIESLNLAKIIIESSYKQPFIIATHDSHFDDAADVIITIEKIDHK